MDTIEFRARCPECNWVRSLFGPLPAKTPADLDAIEVEATRRGSMEARCHVCGTVESIAMFVDGVQAEPWKDADATEAENGPEAGPLPSKPWPDTN